MKNLLRFLYSIFLKGYGNTTSSLTNGSNPSGKIKYPPHLRHIFLNAIVQNQNLGFLTERMCMF